VRATAPKLKCLDIPGVALDSKDPRRPSWPVYGYPMLCVVGKNDGKFPKNQGDWRLVQCVFGAVLTREIRAAEIGVEVVSREGFGSLFPTLADLPCGIRLDPGLLPPTEGALAIVATLKVVHDFITRMQALDAKQASWVGKMGGMDAAQLELVDKVMSNMHAFTLADLDAKGTDYVARLASLNGSASECVLPDAKVEVEYPLDVAMQLLRSVKAPRFKRAPQPKVSGYGSDSDYEEEADEEDAKTPVKQACAIKKYSVVSGMAALNIATVYGMGFSSYLFNKGGLNGTGKAVDAKSDIAVWAPYFELDYAGLSAGIVEKSKAGVRVLLFDGAPNPINIDAPAPVGAIENMGAIVIDTTNNTSMEKAAYVKHFQKSLAVATASEGAGGVLILVDSASKHPTGGDLVHGVMRVFGARASVELFHKMAMLQRKTNRKAHGQTVLSAEESAARKAMNTARLVTKNSDLWRWLELLWKRTD
jgi:hypothetical protein